MHSTTGPSGATYFHNGDYSGAIMVFVDELPPARDPGRTVEIPFEDMVALVTDHLRKREISRWENYTSEQIFDRLGRNLAE